MNSKVRFGIAGTGFVADVVADAIEDAEAKVVAVAGRRRESADAFADKQGGHHPQSSAPSCPHDSGFCCFDPISGRSSSPGQHAYS
jgi:glutamyl-tRNA reductase